VDPPCSPGVDALTDRLAAGAGGPRTAAGPVVGLPGAVRHGLVEAKKRKRRRGDYRRWERSRSMELWQIDAMGAVHLAGGQEVKVFTGRFGRGRGR
jgi:hypothetical protein